MISVSGFLISFFCSLAVAQWNEFGTTGTPFLYHHDYCTYGSCGTWPNQYCCGVYPWVIVVSVMAGIVVMPCIVAAICCAVKRQGSRGRLRPPAQRGPTVNYTSSSGAQQVDFGYQQPQPPAYGNQQSQPPAFGYQQPYPSSYWQLAPSQYPVPGQQGEDPTYPPKPTAPAPNPH